MGQEKRIDPGRWHGAYRVARKEWGGKSRRWV